MKVGIVGLGLIGGSVGLALRDPSRELVGFDPNPTNSKVALDRFCIDRLGTLDEISRLDVVFVATPPDQVLGTLQHLSKIRSMRTVLTDCTSVKQSIAEWGLESGETKFVPGHPMAGHEKSGPGYASAWLFRGARWLLTPLKETDPVALQAVTELVSAMGAIPVLIDPLEHDRQVAVTSHLPHAFAGLLLKMAEGIRTEDLSGGSWKDLTRVGGVDPDLWSQIFLGNSEQLSQILSEASMNLGSLAIALKEADKAAVHEFFQSAQSIKRASSPSASSTGGTKKNK